MMIVGGESLQHDLKFFYGSAGIEITTFHTLAGQFCQVPSKLMRYNICLKKERVSLVISTPGARIRKSELQHTAEQMKVIVNVNYQQLSPCIPGAKHHQMIVLVWEGSQQSF